MDLPNLYHWAPRKARDSIIKRGLLPTTPTLIEIFTEQGEGPWNLRPSIGVDTVKAVCFGWSPSDAWSLSGALGAARGSRWDLWEAELDERMLIKIMDSTSEGLGEVRVLQKVPKRMLWHVGTRVRGSTRWSHA